LVFRAVVFTGVLLCSAGLGAAGGQAPVNETLDLTLLTLNRMQLQPLRQDQPGLLPAKASALPDSVRPYLRPTHQIDTLSRGVQKAAAQVRRGLAPGARQKDRLRDSRAVAQALSLWLDAHLILDPAVAWASQPALDRRLAYPRASAMLAAGRVDADGKVLVAVALLRALRVPARLATARGHLVAQYWVALPPVRGPSRPAKRTRRKAGRPLPLAPLGWWECMDPDVLDAEIDAWSLDASDLELIRFKPKQELSSTLLAWQRAAFDENDSQAARAAFDASLALGSLTQCAQARPLSEAAGAVFRNLTQGSRTLWVLTAQHWRLQAQGPMGAMEHVQILAPYRPALASWGRERPPSLRGLEVEEEGVWTDRPQRLRLHKDRELQGEWAIVPPPLGMLHWYDLGVRRHASVIQAQRMTGRIEGVLLRSDNLTGRRGWQVKATAQGRSASAQTVVGDDGHFSLPLEPALEAADCIDLSAPGPDDEGDFQRLMRP
jgi:hypothetical protein